MELTIDILRFLDVNIKLLFDIGLLAVCLLILWKTMSGA
jgi:hypothetical protein